MTENELRSAFRALRDSVPQTADERVEERLRAAFRAKQRRRHSWREVCLKVAASVVIALGLYFLLLHRYEAQKSAVNQAPDKEPGFVVLPYGQSDVPIEQPVIVRVQVPASKLGGLGLALPALGVGSRVEADLLVGQDGVARAVRVNRQIRP